MDQISIRITKQLLDDVDQFATGNNQAERLRWIIEQGLGSVHIKVALSGLEQRLKRIEDAPPYRLEKALPKPDLQVVSLPGMDDAGDMPPEEEGEATEPSAAIR